MQVRENLTVKASSLRIEDCIIKNLRGKDIASVKVVWGGSAGRSVMLELKSRMRESYLDIMLE